MHHHAAIFRVALRYATFGPGRPTRRLRKSIGRNGCSQLVMGVGDAHAEPLPRRWQSGRITPALTVFPDYLLLRPRVVSCPFVGFFSCNLRASLKIDQGRSKSAQSAGDSAPRRRCRSVNEIIKFGAVADISSISLRIVPLRVVKSCAKIHAEVAGIAEICPSTLLPS